MIKQMKQFLPAALLLLALSCTQKEPENLVTLAAPTDLMAEQLSSDSVVLTWTDNCDNESGYYVFSSASSKPAATLEADSRTYTFTDLAIGATYSFSIRAFGEGNSVSPLVRTEPMVILSADQRNYVDDDSPKVGIPGIVEPEQISNTSARIVWEATSDDALGYNIYIRDTSEAVFRDLEAHLEKGTRQYTFEGLKLGTVYIAGVQATGAEIAGNSAVRESLPFKINDLSNAPAITIGSVSSTSAYILVDYTIDKLQGNKPEYGVCLSAERTPTVRDIVFRGPSGKSGGLQLISASTLEYGTTYRLRVFAKSGDDYYYSASKQIALKDAPEAITFNWSEVTGLGLPEAVKVYKTTDKLNGRNFNAWYAVASTKDVEFRVQMPSSGVKTIDRQAEDAGDCYVLVNGGIFSMTLEGNPPIGFALTDGVQTPWRVADDGLQVDHQYWGADSKLHNVARAMFGVDRSGTPGVYWSYTPSHGTVSVYDRPLPEIAGETSYIEPDATFPCEPASWTPYQAVTCGPVLLKNGVCPFDDGKTQAGYWLSNFEFWANDIFGVVKSSDETKIPDRTSVGYTADGKIILFVCDGRIDSSKGATTLELSRIMKGLGCVGAINLDGGGSTGMWAGGKHLNSLYTGEDDPHNPNETFNRPVKATLGFFKKR